MTMNFPKPVSLKDIMEACPFVLNPLYSFPLHRTVQVEGYIHRPGLLLAGYRPEHKPEHHIMVLGEDEFQYLRHLDDARRKECLESFWRVQPPVLILCGKDLDIPDEFIVNAQAASVPLFHCPVTPREFLASGFRWLEELIVPLIKLNGNLMAIFGRGILIVGPSGIGKSECSLELMTRGHRLVADDVVEVRCFPNGELLGRAPELSEGLMEIRGLGVVDVRLLFGTLSIQPEVPIELVIELAEAQSIKESDRLASHFDAVTVFRFEPFEVGRPLIVLPVVSGRNLGILVETAVRWFMLNARESERVKDFFNQIDRRARGVSDDG